MARPKKEQPEVEAVEAEYSVSLGRYTITKPHDQYVVKLGDDVVYASQHEQSAKDYVDLVQAK